MKFNLEEECKEVKVSELSNGGSHLEFFIKDDSKLKEIWCGNIITFHT